VCEIKKKSYDTASISTLLPTDPDSLSFMIGFLLMCSSGIFYKYMAVLELVNRSSEWTAALMYASISSVLFNIAGCNYFCSVLHTDAATLI